MNDDEYCICGMWHEYCRCAIGSGHEHERAKCGYKPTECKQKTRDRKRKKRSPGMSPYALCEVSGLSAVVRRKYPTRAECERWAGHCGLTLVIVSPGTKIGECVTLVNPKKLKKSTRTT